MKVDAYNDTSNIKVSAGAVSSKITRQYVTKIIKPYIKDGKNILLQSSVSEPNTKYIIKYDFELNTNITIPANCVLEFDGGSIINEDNSDFTITGQKTILVYNQDIEDILKGTKLLGSFTHSAGFSGDYNDLKDKPTIPIVPENVATINTGTDLPNSAKIGFMFFYTPEEGTSIPVWWNGKAWVDATGAEV